MRLLESIPKPRLAGDDEPFEAGDNAVVRVAYWLPNKKAWSVYPEPVAEGTVTAPPEGHPGHVQIIPDEPLPLTPLENTSKHVYRDSGPMALSQEPFQKGGLVLCHVFSRAGAELVFL